VAALAQSVDERSARARSQPLQGGIPDVGEFRFRHRIGLRGRIVCGPVHQITRSLELRARETATVLENSFYRLLRRE
jgi:hypothetical protein